MAQAEKGSRVKVHYTGTFQDGSVFDTSVSGEPLEFVVGDGTMIAGFDKAVQGMHLGDVVNVVVPAEEAYGEFDEDLVVEVDRAQWPAHLKPEPGVQVSLEDGDGNTVYATIKEVKPATIILDANHHWLAATCTSRSNW